MRRCTSAEKMFGEYNNSIHRWRTVLYDDVSECMTGNEFPTSTIYSGSFVLPDKFAAKIGGLYNGRSANMERGV